MRFLVLGPLEVEWDGGDLLPIAGSKERAILACLIANGGRAVSVDTLIEELWGERPPRTAEKTLSSHVSRLRRALRPGRSLGTTRDVLRSHGDGYSLESAGNFIDAIRFEELSAEGHALLAAGQPNEAVPALEAALELWRGAAYHGYRFARFGATEGERLDELRRTATEDLVDSKLAAGGHGQLVAELEAMVREEPLRERRWSQLMFALYRSRRQAEALQAFTRARAVLVDELGVEPGPELQHLQAAILAQDTELERAWPAHPEPLRPTDVCPYKGLARFETADAEFFFGREQMIAEAVGRLVRGRFLALIGSSGSGKSSLLRAGVVHTLAAGAIPGSDRWTYALMRPGDHPLDVLARTMPDPRHHGRSVLAVDQFEEVFTACLDDVERSAFLDALTEAAVQPEGSVMIVIAMRADFYGRCAKHRAFASLVASDQILVGPMDEEELRCVIERPAERAGLRVDEKLTDTLVADTLDQPGALPLLSTALLELWTRRRDGTLHLDGYLRAGGVDGAVARLAEEAFGRLDDDGQAAAKRVLLRLAASGDRGEIVPRRAPLSEFDLDRYPSASRALDVLTDARLITVDGGTAEVAHEALLHEWPRLRSWLEDDAEGRKLHRRLTASSQTWDEGGRDGADLYRGPRLTAALEWADDHDADPNDLEREFLRASRAASEGEAGRTRRTNRRLRGLLTGVAVLLAVSLVIGNLALTQRDQARNALALADAGRLASRSLVEEDPALALILAREAVHLHDSVETRSALFSALERSPAITNRIYAPGGPSSVGDETQWIAISSDGKTLAIGDADEVVTFIDAVRKEPIGTVDVGSGTDRATFSPDGSTVAIVTSKDELVSVDVASQTERARVPAQGPVDAISYSPDGTRLLTAEVSGRQEFLVPREPVTLEPSAPPVHVPGDVPDNRLPTPPLTGFSMAFTPDGRSLVTTSQYSETTTIWDADLSSVRDFPVWGDALAVSPDGDVAAVTRNSDARNEGGVSFLDLRTGHVRVGTDGHHGPAKTRYEAVGVAFTPDGRSVVSVGNDSRFIIWDVASGSVRESLTGTGDLPLRGPAISPDGATAFTTDRNREVGVWDLSGARRLARPFTAGSGFTQWPWFAMSPDGRTIAVASASDREFGRSGTIALLDTSTLHVLRRIRYADGSPEGLAFGADSTTLAVSSWSSVRGRSDVQLWDVASGRPLTSDLPGIDPQVIVFALEFNPDGRTLAGGARSFETEQGRIYVWSLDAPQRVVDRVDTRRTVNDLTFSPDGSLLTAPTGWADGGDVVIWDPNAHSIVRTIHADDAAVFSTDLSNDGRTLVTGGQTSIVRLWDIATGSPVGPSLSGLTGWADTVDMSPDGNTVLGADSAGNVLLWDAATGTVLGDPLPGPRPSEYLAALFTPDGRGVVVVSDTGSAWLWDVDPSNWKIRACEIAGRSLTRQEWQEFLPDRPYHATCGS